MTFRFRSTMPSAPRILPTMSPRILYPTTMQFGTPSSFYSNPCGMGGWNNLGGLNQFNGLNTFCGPMGYNNNLLQNPYLQLGMNTYQNNLLGGFNNCYGGYNNPWMRFQGGMPYQNNFFNNCGMNRFPGAFGAFPGMQLAIL